MSQESHYQFSLKWTGNRGEGTASAKAFDRSFTLSGGGKNEIIGSSDPAFLGSKDKWCPEELLVASIASCHMLWFLYLASAKGIVVTEYSDDPKGVLSVEEGGLGSVSKVVLNPKIMITDPKKTEEAKELNKKAHELCFVARSVKTSIEIQPAISEDRRPK